MLEANNINIYLQFPTTVRLNARHLLLISYLFLIVAGVKTILLPRVLGKDILTKIIQVSDAFLNFGQSTFKT